LLLGWVVSAVLIYSIVTVFRIIRALVVVKIRIVANVIVMLLNKLGLLGFVWRQTDF
jgi:hypothetical protein